MGYDVDVVAIPPVSHSEVNVLELAQALDTLAKDGAALCAHHRFEWDSRTQHAVGALRWLLRSVASRDACATPGTSGLPSLVGIVGGASSGKSTVFNNLLGGRPASRVTARGHCTRGPILAAHDDWRESFESALSDNRLFVGLDRRTGGLDDDLPGSPGMLHVVYHRLDRLRGAAICDTADLTSEPARVEGDVTMAMLPWFDRLVVLVDHERWFDRQTMGRLHDAAEQFGQERVVIFNRSRHDRLGEADRVRLERQAERFGATQHLILDYRQGRGLRVFPPGTLDSVVAAIAAPPPDRRGHLERYLSRAATPLTWSMCT